MYTQRIAASLFLASLFSGSAVAQSSSPFDFAEPPKQEEVKPPEVIIPQNPELSDRQAKQVFDMINKAVKELSSESSRADDNTVKINGKSFLLLRTQDEYVGVTSGMHVIYATDKQDYYYFDSQIYKKVITEQEYNTIRAKTAEKVASVIGQMIEDAGISTEKNANSEQ